VTRLSRAEQQSRTRDALVVAAREHFAEHGYAAASLDRIAADAGFTRGAIYANFDGKAGLFLAVLDARLHDQIRQLEDVGADLDALARWRRANAERQRGLSLAVLEFRVAALRDQDLTVRLRQRERAVRSAFARLISQVADSAGVELPMAPEHVAVALIALGDGITQQHYLDPDTVDLEIFEHALAGFLRILPGPT
jgi:AcrR family transcriptional regulator